MLMFIRRYFISCSVLPVALSKARKSGPPPPGPAGEFAAGVSPMVAGQAKCAAPLLFEFNSAVAAALCAVAVSAGCTITEGPNAEIVSSREESL